MKSTKLTPAAIAAALDSPEAVDDPPPGPASVDLFDVKGTTPSLDMIQKVRANVRFMWW